MTPSGLAGGSHHTGSNSGHQAGLLAALTERPARGDEFLPAAAAAGSHQHGVWQGCQCQATGGPLV